MFTPRKPASPPQTSRQFGSIAFLSYMRETPVGLMALHTMLFLVWASIGVFFYDAVKTLGAGRPLADATLSRVVVSSLHVDSYLKTHRQVDDLLGELRGQTGSARAILVLFTNGKASIGGVPFVHASAYAESHDPLLSDCMPEMRDIDVALLAHLDRTLAGEPVLERDPLVTTPVRTICGSATTLRGPMIRTLDGTPHGFIVLSWNASTEPLGLGVETVRHRVTEYSFVLAGVLSTLNIDRLVKHQTRARH